MRFTNLQSHCTKNYFANVSQGTQRMTVVQITCKQFFSFLHDAETRDEIKRAQQGAKNSLPPNCRKRHREAKVGGCEARKGGEICQMRGKESGKIWGKRPGM